MQNYIQNQFIEGRQSTKQLPYRHQKHNSYAVLSRNDSFFYIKDIGQKMFYAKAYVQKHNLINQLTNK